MSIRGILFDNDGTLVDTQELILSSFRYATEQVLGQSIPDSVLMKGVGTPLETQMATFSDDAQVQSELSRVYRMHNHAHHDQEVALFPDILEGLTSLQGAGVAMGVVTAKRHELAWRGLDIVGAAPYLQCLVGADDCALSKPDPAPIVEGLRQLGLSPQDCFYVGDSPFDIQAGNAAGCPTVAVLWGMFSEADLRAEHPTHVVASFNDLVKLALEC